LTSTVAVSTATPVIIQAAVSTPWCLVSWPKTSENGRKLIHDSAPTPETTPERIVEGTASWSTRET
jgi:hypothetical protein